jgi:hypothetical protein
MGKICIFCQHKRPENRCSLIVSEASVEYTERCCYYEPVEEVLPVVHAHWIEKEYVELKDTGVYAMLGTCSNCNCEVITDESAEYCSNCSAVMDEEEPHEMCFDFEKAFHGALMNEEVDDE